MYYNWKWFSSSSGLGLIVIECWNVTPMNFVGISSFLGIGGIASMPPLTAVAPVPMGSIPVVGMSPPLVPSVPPAAVPPLANGAPPVIQPLPAFAHPGMSLHESIDWSFTTCILLFILAKSSVSTFQLCLSGILFPEKVSSLFHLLSHFFFNTLNGCARLERGKGECNCSGYHCGQRWTQN